MKNIIVGKYLPYAKETIINRAVPYIDGYKPVARKTLYAMMELNLFDTKKKCARIVGDTMGKYHPHGDSSIYECLCGMTDKYAGFNAPVVAGQGNFGKASSSRKNGIKAAQMRYPEAGFTPLAAELFDGIKENAVDMVDNFDETEKEPSVLPVKFPNIIVNTNKGVAVGLSSYTPSYTLRNACLGVASILRGNAKTPEDVVDILGAPDFSTGGYIHSDRELLLKLLNTGRATFSITGNVHAGRNSIIIDTVPITTNFEKVSSQIKALAQTPEGRDIVDINDITGLNSQGISIEVRKGADARKLLTRLYQYTDLRDKVSFLTQIIWKDVPVEMGVWELMHKWIEFRSNCVKRVYTVRVDKIEKKVHVLSVWELIKEHIPEVVETMSKNSESVAKSILMQRFGIDNEQIEYLFDMKVRNICTDKALKSLNELAKAREEYRRHVDIRDNEQARYTLIAEQLEEIANKYGTDRVCEMDTLVPVEETIKEKVVIPDEKVSVYVTKRGFIKTLNTTAGMLKVDTFLADDDELVGKPILCSLRDKICVFTYSGYCYKIPVHMIESSRTMFKQYIWDLADRKDKSDILHICNGGDYTGNFNIIYNTGRGRKVFLREVAGASKVYKGVFEAGNENTLKLVLTDKFFLITCKRKAAYADTTSIGEIATRSAFKVARIPSGDALYAVQPAEKVPNIESVDITKYLKGYCVSIGDDKLW